jgi:hypothetical protein
MDILLLAGQSNMEGRGSRDGLEPADARVFQFKGAVGHPGYRTISPDLTPLHHPGSKLPEQDLFGVGEVIGRLYAEATGRRVLLVPTACGGTPMLAPPARWLPGDPGGDLYENAIAQANRALAAAEAVELSRFVGTFWIQGETDGDGGIAGETYRTALTALIAGFRSRIAGAAASWFVLGGMVPEAIATRSGYAAIDAAHRRVAAEVRGVALAEGPAGHTADDLHYTTSGIRMLAPRMVAAIPEGLGQAPPSGA